MRRSIPLTRNSVVGLGNVLLWENIKLHRLLRLPQYDAFINSIYLILHIVHTINIIGSDISEGSIKVNIIVGIFIQPKNSEMDII